MDACISIGEKHIVEWQLTEQQAEAFVNILIAFVGNACGISLNIYFGADTWG